ncbi:1-phosphofructokinase family hexose kinase [Nocardia sp. alder85J]|uniref:1-phosphofructokinase family hexose kinase n=1 Tax=Nocardia sp. alder85J TaxID=2862949 RepID=UPI001CD6B056|nr:1-phosphofructokinase family hexose kinase [Nocardia sp. alder85J]MCX4092435.1 1-phosphofructokinase family hexose kinase [Nocardia sp. alder85J]
MSVVTVTMNPAIDIATGVPQLRQTEKMRCETPRFDPGGGGINVARTVLAVGGAPTAVFPMGGHSGRLLEQLVSDAGVAVRPIPVAGWTRESFSVTDRVDDRQYRFVLPGASLSPVEQQQCLDAVATTLVATGARFLVASGSLPPDTPPDFWQRLVDQAALLGVAVAVDTSGEALRHLYGGVELLKPSVRELSDCVGRPLPDRADQIAAARQLVDAGVARIVVVSLGADGAVAVTADWSQWFPPVAETVVSGIGAGDAMVGGLVVALARGWTIDDAVRLGIAAATAALATPGTSPGRPEHIAELYRRLTERDADSAPAGVLSR